MTGGGGLWPNSHDMQIDMCCCCVSFQFSQLNGDYTKSKKGRRILFVELTGLVGFKPLYVYNSMFIIGVLIQ